MLVYVRASCTRRVSRLLALMTYPRPSCCFCHWMRPVRPWPPSVSGDCVTGGKAYLLHACTSPPLLPKLPCVRMLHIWQGSSYMDDGLFYYILPQKKKNHPTWTHKPAFFFFFHNFIYYTLIYSRKYYTAEAQILQGGNKVSIVLYRL